MICVKIIAMVKFKFSLYTILMFLFGTTIFCCTSRDEIPSLIVGQDFTNTNTRVILIDTLTVEMSTMKFDSLNTTNTQRLLVGKYNDSYFGKVKASPYFRLTSSDFNLDSDAELDSIALILSYDDYFYNDTTQVAEINVHRLTERLDSDDDAFFNTSEIPYDTNPIASFTYFPRPSRDSLHVPIPIDFGQNIFTKIQDGDIDDNQSLFRELEGLTIQPSEQINSAIVGLVPDRVYLRFYYRIPDELDEDEREYDLSIDTFNNLTYFNAISSDVNSLPIENITDQEEVLLSTDTNNLSYHQAGVGYATRIEFPSLNKLSEIEGEGTVMEANLQIKPKDDSYSDFKPIIEELSLYIVDQNNELSEQLFNSQGFVFAELTREETEFATTVYNVPVLTFIDRKLNEQPETESALVLISSEYNSTVNSMLLNDAFNEDFEATLNIIYAVYDID